MAETGLQQPSIAVAPRIHPMLRTAGTAVAASAFVALCAHISVPLFFTPVPVTLQPFAVLLLGLLLSPGAAFASLAFYLLEGAAGLPVFTPLGPGGMLQLLGPTGGYLLSYPLVAPLVSWLFRGGRRSFTRGIWSSALGNVVILAAGAIWLAARTHASFSSVFSLAVVPFLPGDALKVIAATAAATSFQRLRLRSSTDQ